MSVLYHCQHKLLGQRLLFNFSLAFSSEFECQLRRMLVDYMKEAFPEHAQVVQCTFAKKLEGP